MCPGTDAEATLSAEYGGTGGSNAAVDAVYVALGRVLTISGRTIKDEAQVSKAFGNTSDSKDTNSILAAA